MADRNSAVLRFINAPWLKPLIFLVLIVVAWDIVIRVFKIPPYQIPAPTDVIVTLWQEWPMLMREAWPTTVATICHPQPPRIATAS